MTNNDDQHNNDPRTGFKAVHEGSYDKITRPEVELRVPGYFMRHWSQHLSTGAFALYLHLRHMCWYDEKNPQNSREFCWPKQSTLARLIGSSRRSVQRHLQELEYHQLISRDPTYNYDREKQKKVRSVDVYRVPFRVPLVPEDQPDALLIDAQERWEAAAEHPENAPVASERQNDAQVAVDPSTPRRQSGAQVSYPRPKRQTVVGTATPNWPRRSSTEVITNVDNVTFSYDKNDQAQTAEHVGTPRLTNEEREEHEGLVFMIGEQLKRMAGDHTEDDHRSAGFHRRVVAVMDEQLIREALMATRDAVEDQRAGKKALRLGPGAYFAGIIRQIADREGISLGVEWKAPPKIPR